VPVSIVEMSLQSPELADLRASFADDGVVKVSRAVDVSWIERLEPWVERHLNDPSPWVNDNNPGASSNRLFTDRYMWRHEPLIREFAMESGVAEVAGQLMDATSARLYFDHLLVKEPGTMAPTPWHQDLPYWPFLGRQIASVWVALTEATVESSSLEFVRGSHRWDSYFAPKNFGAREDHPGDWTADADGEEMPDIEADRSAFDVIGFDVQPGDALVFSAWIVHGAPGNVGGRRRAALSTRWLGDDAVWHPHPGSDPTVGQEHVVVAPGASVAGDDDRFPVGWTA
jgi:ectoine hydroxylase-related dioxygenase (phytanoyl-CoA dioxygenase family)